MVAAKAAKKRAGRELVKSSGRRSSKKKNAKKNNAKKRH
jgi:hypothetical protein